MSFVWFQTLAHSSLLCILFGFRHWHTGFDFEEKQVVEEVIEEEEELTTEALPMLAEDITATTETVTETTEADQLSTSEHEEKKTFVITGRHIYSKP